MNLDRRSFLKTSALAAAAAAVPFGSKAHAAASTDPILVTVFLRGAADGLNLVVPKFDYDRYADLRQGIAIPKADLIDFCSFGLHPKLRPLKGLERDLCIVHAAGSKHQTRSHFEAMDYMERAKPGAKTGTGWLNKTLIELGATNVMNGISFGDALAMNGSAARLSTKSLGAMPKVAGSWRTAAQAMFQGGKGLERSRLNRGLRAQDTIEAKVAGTATPEFTGAKMAKLGLFGVQLRDASALIKSDVGVRIMNINMGGWDTHESENTRLPALADTLATGLRTFWDDLSVADRNRTLVLVMSEFGRRAEVNGTGGTDHGSANMMMALGGNVGGGRVQANWPGLDEATLNANKRDLKVTTDFRDVFDEVLQRHLKLTRAQRTKILDGHTLNGSKHPGIFL